MYMYDVISSLSVHKIMPISDPGVESPKVYSIIMWHQPISQGEHTPIWDQRVHPFWPAREKHCLQLTEPILDPLKKTVYGNLSDPSQPWDLNWIRYIYGYSPTTQPGRNVMARMINQQWGAPNYHTFYHSLWPPHQGQLRRDKNPYQTKDINQEEYTFLATMASKYIQHGSLEAWIQNHPVYHLGKSHNMGFFWLALTPTCPTVVTCGTCALEMGVLELWMAHLEVHWNSPGDLCETDGHALQLFQCNY